MDYTISRTGAPVGNSPAHLRILQLGEAPVRAKGAWRFKNLAPEQQMGRLLYFRARAMEAELRGYWPRADFFWRQALSVLATLFPSQEPWQTVRALAAKADPVLSAQSWEDFREGFVRDVFWDTLCALYNGYITQKSEPPADSRAFTHLASLLNVQKLSNDCLGLAANTVLPALLAQIAAELRDSNPDRALQLAKKATAEFPDEKAAWDCRLHVIQTRLFGKLSKGENALDIAKDLPLLDSAVTELEQLTESNPYCTTVYDTAADVLHVRSIRLAQSNRIGDALADNRRVFACSPQHESATKNREQLLELLQNMREGLEKVRRQIAAQPGTGLNAQGLQLQSQVERAVSLLKTNDATAVEKRTIVQRRLAQARAVWIRLGVPTPRDRWDERATTLYNAMLEVANASPTDSMALRDKWRAAVLQAPLLEGVSEDKVVTYLCTVLELSTPTPASVAAEQERSPDAAGTRLRPLIEGLPAMGLANGPPFSFWLFSPEERRLKIQVACAAALLLITLGVQTLDGHRSATRARLLGRLNGALTSGQPTAVMDAAQSYLAAPAPLRGDPSETEVRGVYLQALKRQLATHAGVPDADSNKYLRRFGQLVGNRT